MPQGWSLYQPDVYASRASASIAQAILKRVYEAADVENAEELIMPPAGPDPMMMAKAKGEELKPFAYKSKGSLASLGMSKAVAEVYGIKLSGFLAWLLWRGFYLSFLPGLPRRCGCW